MRLRCDTPRPRLDLDDPDLRLTPAQKQALAIDRELVVSAGAGAGKTTVLSLRYVALLLELAGQAVLRAPTRPRPDITAVLVLTFTEKAAEEMAERCYRRLLHLADDVRDGAAAQQLTQAYGPTYPGQLAAALDHLVDHFEAARIGTFHGFCAQVLRAHPAEAATPPDFEVLDELDARELHARVATQVLDQGYAEQPERMRRLVASVGSHASARDALLHVLGQRTVLRSILARHAAGQITIRDVLELFPESPAQLVDWLERVASPVFEEILDAISPSGGGGRIPEIRRLNGLIADLVEQADPDVFDIIDRYREVLGALCTADGKKLRSLDRYDFVGKKGAWKALGNAAYDSAKERMAGVAQRAADWPERLKLSRGLPTRADSVMLEALQVLGELAIQADEHLEAWFDQERVLDFDALQERAVQAVLTHEPLRQALIAQHRYLMVDEFQDTDQRQWALVRALGRPHADQPSDRIFVVGDAKQAIYRFRGGDVTVYRAALDELGVQPVTFPDNFRSRSELIGWFNTFFGEVLGPPSPTRPAFEAPYSPLKASRGQSGGTITLAVHEGGTAAETALNEAEGVARVLAAQVLAGKGAFAGLDLMDPTRHREPPVAVLLQTRTHLTFFEAALRRHGVPFVVAKGVGFWSRQEVRDVVNTVHALATDDPISMVGALRSPLFGLSDQDLQDLHDAQWGSPSAGGHTLSDFGRYDLDDLAPPRVHRAVRRLQHLRAVRDRLAVSDLIRELLVHASAAHALALQDPSGQAQANVDRLVEHASRFDGLGPLGLPEAARHFVAQVLAGEAQAEAPIPPTQARVVLMTVHASKGLEFPVVVVPGCGRRPGGRPASLTHGRVEGQWHVACRALDPTAPVRTRVTTGLHGLLQHHEQAEQQAESKRLLYVAATRARDHLVLVGTLPKPGRARSTTSWSDLLTAVHGTEGTEDADGLRLVVDSAEGADSSPRAGLAIVDLQDWLGLQPDLSTAGQAAPLPDADAARRLAPIHPQPVLEVSPSSLDRFAKDPVKWYRRDRLGVPDDAEQPRAEVRMNLAAARGEVIHSLLEDDVVHDEATAIARWRARAFAEGASADLVEDGVPELLDHLRRTAADPLVQSRLMAEGMDEVRFRMPLGVRDESIGDLVLTGQIDRLWRDADGSWVVLDWKSERVRGRVLDAASRHARQLLAYAWAADRILRAHGQPGVSRAEVYFTDTAQLVSIGPLTDVHWQAVQRELTAVARAGAMSWEQIQADPPQPAPHLTGVDLAITLVGDESPHAPAPPSPPQPGKTGHEAQQPGQTEQEAPQLSLFGGPPPASD